MRMILRFVYIGLAAAALWVFLPVEARAIDGPHAGFGTGGQTCNGCHVPHAASEGTILLWNRAYSTKDFSWSDATATSSGTTLPTNIKTWSGTTRNCLSCHDGTLTDKPFGAQISTGDLKGNHPVAVPYPFGGKANKYNGATTYGLTAGAAVSGWVASPANVKIYSDPVETAPNNRGIECASCHDPHDKATFTKYLRDSLTASAICNNCHSK
ncbi:MAG: cytochrome c3 family protein [Candidatus Binatia bacterium]